LHHPASCAAVAGGGGGRRASVGGAGLDDEVRALRVDQVLDGQQVEWILHHCDACGGSQEANTLSDEGGQ
jgi:hypothetical protein